MAKESVYIRKELNSYRIGLVQQHGKRKCLHKKRVQLTQDWLGASTWSLSHCFATPIWLSFCHVHTLYTLLWCVLHTQRQRGFWDLGAGTPAGSQNSPAGNQSPGPRTPRCLCVYDCRTCLRFIFYWRNVALLYYGPRKKRTTDKPAKPTKYKISKRPKRKRNANGIFFCAKQRNKKKYSYLNKPLILWKTWIHNSLSTFFCQTTTTDTLKHRVEMLLEAN